MTVRDLRKYLEERNLVHSQKLTALQNTRIGVDGFHWLTQLLHERTEPFQVAMGGLPITLTNKIEKEINRWKSAGITPVFVFNGISHKKVDVGPSPIKAHTFVVAEELERKRRSAFNAFERGQVKEASALFITASALPTDFINYLFQYFTEHNIEFFRAPYVTWGQLAHFMNEKEPMIHAIYAADEQIMFNVPKLILDVNFEDEIFRYVDKNEILANLGLNESQFLDCCLLAGSFFGKTMPHIVEFVKKDSDKKAFAIALEMVQVYRSGLVVTQFDHDSATQFLFSKALINNHVILESDGTAGHLNPGSVPKDYNEVIGPKLPNDLYYLLSQSVISPQALSSLVAGAVLETQPLADSQEYHALISSLSHLRSASFNLLTTPLNEYFQKKPISVIYWPAGDIPTQELDRSILKITDGLCWQLSDADIQKQLKLQKSQAIDFQFCLNWKPAPSTSLTTKFTTPEQLRSFLLLKTLDVLGYFTKTRSSYDLNPYARALQRAKLYPDQAIIILELLRNQAMTTRRFSLVFKKYAASITAPVKKSKFQAELILIERVMSMVPMTFKFIQWGERAGVSQDLLCYNSIVKILYKSMRQVIEMLLAATFLEGHCDLELTQNLCLTRLSIHLPFFQETNTAMGVVARYLLETPVDTLSVDQLPKKFTSCVDVLADFRDRAVPFWNQTVDMVRTLYGAKSGLDAYGASILEQFESADKFLQEKLESLSTLGQKNQ